MATEWMDNFLNGKVNKEATLSAQGENAADHFERKVEANPWVNEVLSLDPVAVEAEYQAKLAAEAMTLGKEAALVASFEDIKAETGVTPTEVVNNDFQRDVRILSDYALAELLAEARGHKAQNTNEMFYELKEKAKKDVASSREKAEKALLDLISDHTMLDWQKAFKEFTKESKPEEPKEKDLFKTELPDKAHNFNSPTEDKFKLPKDQEEAIPGNGREADERTEVTEEAGVLKADITEGLGKQAEFQPKTGESCSCKPGVSRDNCPSCEGTGQKVDFKQIREKKEAAVEKKAEYSGWSNYSTWGLALWLDNEEDLYNESRQLAIEATSPEELAEDLKAHYSNLLSEKGEKDKNSDEVNWLEIANDLLAESKENAEYDRSQGAGGVIDSLPTMDVEQEKDKLIDALRTETDPEKQKALKRKYQHLTMASVRKVLNKTADGPSATDNCPVCGSEGTDLGNDMQENMACQGCGITYGSFKVADKKAEAPAYPRNPMENSLENTGIASAAELAESFINGNISYVREQIGGDLEKFMAVMDVLGYGSPEGQSFQRIMRKAALKEIKNAATKTQVIQKIAELSKTAEVASPWKVILDADGKEVIARVENETKTEKVSEEDKTEELQK